MRQLTGSETVSGLESKRLLDFWRWAFSDLRQNVLRGIFAEWLVAQILGIELDSARDPWAPADLETGDGVRIEVKSAAYMQAWHTAGRASGATWSCRPSRTWDAETMRYSQEMSHNAHLYVYCVHTEVDGDKWDALDVSQWKFYLLSKEKVQGLGAKSISEAGLRRMSQPLTADALKDRANEAIADLRSKGSI